MLLSGVGYLGLFGLRFMRGSWFVSGAPGSGGEKGDADGDSGAGSFPLIKKVCLVLGV